MKLVHALVLVGVCVSVASCDDETELTPQTAVELSLACSGPQDEPFTEGISVSVVQQCNYWRTAGNLHLGLAAQHADTEPNTGVVDITITGMTGPGTYPTDDAGTTALAVGGPRYNGYSAVDGAPSPAGCAIEVLDTDLHELEMPEGFAYGFVSLEVRCPQLVTGQIGVMTCDLTPASFRLVITGCEATQ